MPLARDAGVGVAGISLGVAAALLLPGEKPVEHRTIGGKSDRMDVIRDVPDAGSSPALSFDRVDGDGFVVDRPSYTPQYVADALAACDRAEAEVGGGYVALKRARWEALRDAFASRGIPLPLPSGRGAR